MARVGRRSKLTSEVQSRIVEAIRVGNYTTVAVAYAGVGRTTFYRWMRRGKRAGHGLYRRFYEAVRQANVEAEVRAVAIVQKHMRQSWRAAIAFLERRYRLRWALPKNRGPDPIETLSELLGLRQEELHRIAEGGL